MAAVPDLDLTVPPEWENGVDANSALVSHTPLEFTLDFMLLHARGSQAATALALSPGALWWLVSRFHRR